MTMASNGTMGISPALLQAITQTLSSTAGGGAVISPKSTVKNPAVTPVQTPMFTFKQNGQTYIIVQNLNQLTYPVPTSTTSDGAVQNFGAAPQSNSTSVPTPIIIVKPSTIEHSNSETFNDSVTSGDRKDASSQRSAPQAMLVFQQNDLPMVANTQTIVTGDHVQQSAASAIRLAAGGISSRSSTEGAMTMTEMEGVTAEQDSLAIWPPCYSCPICSDKISGYHYGIFSCESCKGFFKRTVQNGKAFTCRHDGTCDIGVSNRKKCPACRFNKCCVSGMKLEAIRPDRTRGGRSSYKGSYTPYSPILQTSSNSSAPPSTNGAFTPPAPPPQIKRFKPTPPAVTTPRLITSNPAAITPRITASSKQFFSEGATVSWGGDSGRSYRGRSIPHLLEELVVSEMTHDEDRVEMACCEQRMSDADPDPFSSLLHITDHCLYKIVRWARGRPDFANIQTDDQIILLQNCWAELVCINACWKTLNRSASSSPDHGLRLDAQRVVTMPMARDMGIERVVERLMEFTEMIRLLEVDIYDIAALKTLLLMSPDVDNLIDPGSVRERQERVLDALVSYTTERYPSLPYKVSQILAKLPELSRTCILAKELLEPHQRSGKVPTQSLLNELLRGDAGMH